MSASGSRRQTMEGVAQLHSGQPGSQSGSRAVSPSRARPGFPPALGFDPARGDKKEVTVAERIGKRVDLPIEAYTMVS